jgi:hypothetical protein
MMRFNIDSAAKITKVTENAYVYPQVAFADEDLCLEALSRKWALPILKNLITRETVRFNELVVSLVQYYPIHYWNLNMKDLFQRKSTPKYHPE